MNTSLSPGYPQSNGQSERTVQTVKAMLEKAGDPYKATAVASMRRTEALASVKFYQILSIFIFFIRLIILEDFIRLISYNGPCVRLGCSFFLATALKALLSYRNTPLEEVNLSPSQMLMGRRLRTSIPVTEDLLKPQLYDPEDVLPQLKERQRKQKLQHDRKAKELPPLRDGEVVRDREGNKWKPARVTQVLPSPRSYKVETERGEYRRNRRHLLRTEESQIPEITTTPEVLNDEDLTDTEVEPFSVRVAHENPVTPPTGMSTATTTRSGRTIREPQRFKDYVKY